MRIAIALAAFFAASCSTTYECCSCTDRDDRPAAVFVDTDVDGLPDQRISLNGDTDRAVLEWTEQGPATLHTASAGPGTAIYFDTYTSKDGRQTKGSRQPREVRLEQALKKLERAIDDVRRAMRKSAR